MTKGFLNYLYQPSYQRFNPYFQLYLDSISKDKLQLAWSISCILLNYNSCFVFYNNSCYRVACSRVTKINSSSLIVTAVYHLKVLNDRIWNNEEKYTWGWFQAYKTGNWLKCMSITVIFLCYFKSGRYLFSASRM